jgi:hypothetical protein
MWYSRYSKEKRWIGGFSDSSVLILGSSYVKFVFAFNSAGLINSENNIFKQKYPFYGDGKLLKHIVWINAVLETGCWFTMNASRKNANSGFQSHNSTLFSNKIEFKCDGI